MQKKESQKISCKSKKIVYSVGVRKKILLPELIPVVLKRCRSLYNEIRVCFDGALLVALSANVVANRTRRQHWAGVRFDSRSQLDVFLVESSCWCLLMDFLMMLKRFLLNFTISIKAQKVKIEQNQKHEMQTNYKKSC